MLIKFKKKNYADSLSTPRKIFRYCERKWRVKCNLDVCATKKNRKCRAFFDRRRNGLNRRWKNQRRRRTVVWCNPPHSQTKNWIKIAYYEWKNFKTRTVGLIPINTLCSSYGKKYILPHAKFHIITGRINFLNPRTQRPSKLNSVNGYVTIYYSRGNGWKR
jgi:phage N-6-adenine-methyltransferase